MYKLTDKYKFYINFPREGFVEVYPAINAITFKYERENEEVFSRMEMETELFFTGETARKIIKLSQSDQVCLKLEMRIEKRCRTEADFTDYMYCHIALVDTEFDAEFCTIKVVPRSDDNYSCLFANWEKEYNILQAAQKYQINTFVGNIEEIVCEATAGDDLFGNYVFNDCADTSAGWTRVSYKYLRPVNDGGGIGGVPLPVQSYYETKYQREVVTSVSQPAGTGWINIGGGQWARRVPTGSAKYVRSEESFYGTTVYPVTEFRADNGVRLADAIQMTLQECPYTIISNFFGINPDGTNPTNEYYDESPRLEHLYLFQITDVVIADATENATIGKISFKQLYEDLKKMFNIRFIVDDNMNLRIEHISYFDNGKDYSTPQIGIDLTQDWAPKANRLWTYGQSVYSYNKPSIPSEIIFEWAEDVGEFFQGHPIICTSAYVTAGLIENRPLTPYVSDIERVMLREASLEGFVLLECELVGADYQVAYYEIDDQGWKADIQNGYASLFYALDKYHRHSAPCSKLTINNVSITATTVKRNRRQTIEYPNKTIDPDKLVTTAIGDGKIVSREINLVTGHNKIELEHDTE